MGQAAGGARVAPSWLQSDAALRRPTDTLRFLQRVSRIGCGHDAAWDGGNLLPRMRSENSAPVAARPPRGSCFSDADGQIGKHPRGKSLRSWSGLARSMI